MASSSLIMSSLFTCMNRLVRDMMDKRVAFLRDFSIGLLSLMTFSSREVAGTFSTLLAQQIPLKVDELL